MTPSNADRVRASRIRGRKKDGKAVNDADRIWFAEYERRSTKAPRNTPAIAPASAKRNTSAQQLKLAGDVAPSGAHVQQTVPPSGAVDPAAYTWTPTVPAPSADAEPPPPGAPPPPPVGAPVFDANAPGAVPPPSQGDPAAAKQFGLLIGFFVGMGVTAGRELLDELGQVPPEVRVLLASDEAAAGVLQTVQLSAERLAMKYGFTGVPMGDEAVVVGAVLASGALVVRNMKRKRLKKPDASPEEPRTPDGPTAPPSNLDGLWDKRGGGE
jgi:hypothetical protein